jgi:hypothetical protein
MSGVTKVQTTFALTAVPPTIAPPTFNTTFNITTKSLTTFDPTKNRPCAQF